MTNRSSWCKYRTVAPPQLTSDTVIPLPLFDEARSSEKSVTPSLRKRTSAVASAAISSLSSFNASRNT